MMREVLFVLLNAIQTSATSCIRLVIMTRLENTRDTRDNIVHNNDTKLIGLR